MPAFAKRLSAAAAFVLAASAALGAGTVSVNSAFTSYEYPAMGSAFNYRGEAVAYTDNGDVILVGTNYDFASGEDRIRVARFSPDLKAERWNKLIDTDVPATDSTATCVSVRGDAIYVGGYANTGINGWVFRVRASDGYRLWVQNNAITFPRNIADIAADPVDDAVWALSSEMSGWTEAKLRKINGATGAVERTFVLTPTISGFTDAYGLALAITADRIVVGGYIINSTPPSRTRVWLRCLDRGSGASKWFKGYDLADSSSRAKCVSLSVRGSDGAMLVSRAEGAPPAIKHSLSMQGFNPENGETTGPVRQLGSWDVATEPDEWAAGQVAFHPLLPLVFACGRNSARVYSYSGSLAVVDEVWSKTFSVVDLRGIAAFGGFDSSFTVAMMQGTPALNEKMRFETYKLVANGAATGNSLVISPNRLDRSVPGSKVVVSVRGLDPGTENQLAVYDASGHVVSTLKVTGDADGNGFTTWDGTRFVRDFEGMKVAPGVYFLMRADGKGERKPMVVTNGGKK